MDRPLKRHDAIFSLAVVVIGILLLSIVFLNVTPVREYVAERVDVAKVIKRIERAGLEPREAKYWRVIEGDEP
ncbi:MAG: hypothetical protein ACUVXI_04470 [bacterium]